MIRYPKYKGDPASDYARRVCGKWLDTGPGERPDRAAFLRAMNEHFCVPAVVHLPPSHVNAYLRAVGLPTFDPTLTPYREAVVQFKDGTLPGGGGG